MARRGKAFSLRSKASQKRIESRIRRDGLDRSRALRALREGKWQPYARTPERRVPPARIANRPEPDKFKGGSRAPGSDLRAQVKAHKRLLFNEYIKYRKNGADGAVDKYASIRQNYMIALGTDDPDVLRAYAARGKTDEQWRFLYYH